MTLLEWLWSFLPDRCEMPHCERRGVRGNENIFGGKIVCDYCHASMVKDWLINSAQQEGYDDIVVRLRATSMLSPADMDGIVDEIAGRIPKR